MLAEYDSVSQQWAQHGDNRAGIMQAQKVAADAQSSVAELETNVVASFETTNKNVDAVNQNIANINQKVDKDISANEAAIQQKFTAYADATNPSAIYTLKTGIRYNGVNYDAGLSVAATVNGSGGVDTRVAVNANQFVL